ncbi:transposase family protein [Vibrio sp. ArtGut-C1]|uniref:transposase family protein n=1 Tax=Vibrio sp. ArtGut-C1 TaxID=2259137 RepID=UPI000A1907E1|nr:transposase family protein [Vibrio sp. ArtGut-C1]
MINLKYDFLDILFLTVAVVVSVAEGWSDIVDFGNNKLDWLQQYRDFEHGIPVDDTLARIISRTNAIKLSLHENSLWLLLND